MNILACTDIFTLTTIRDNLTPEVH